MQPDPSNASVSFESGPEGEKKTYFLKFCTKAQEAIEEEAAQIERADGEEAPDFTNAGALCQKSEWLVKLVRYGLIHDNSKLTIDDARKIIDECDLCRIDWAEKIGAAICFAVYGQDKPPTSEEMKKKWPRIAEAQARAEKAAIEAAKKAIELQEEIEKERMTRNSTGNEPVASLSVSSDSIITPSTD